MATKTMQTRLQMKRDLYANWVEKNPQLLEGELAVVIIPAEAGAVVQEPAVMLKVGAKNEAGELYNFNDLPWLSAVSADVYDWAKAPVKPAYGANEISGIDAYIAQYVNEQMGISVDTDTQYQIVKVNDYRYKLQSKGKMDSAWADVEGSEIVIPEYDDSALVGRVEALENAEDADTKYGIEYDSVNKKIKLVEDGSAMEIDATAFIKDGMVSGVEIKEVEGVKNLVITFNTDAGKEAINVPLTQLVDIYTGVDGSEIKVAVSSDNKISAELKNGSITKERLSEGVQNTLDQVGTNAIHIEALETRCGNIETKNGEQDNAISALEESVESYRGQSVELSQNLEALTGRVTAAEGVNTTQAASISNLETAVAGKQESLVFDGTYNAASNKVATVSSITSRIESLDASVAASAADGNKYSVLTGITQADGKLDKWAEVKLEAVAKTGNVNDLVQTEGDYIVFDCGTASKVI